MDLFLSSAPGLEELLASEVTELRLGTPVVTPGGVQMKGGLRSIYRANLQLGLAMQVRARLGEFLATSFGELVKKTSMLELERWVDPARPLRVTATCRGSRLNHSDAVIERVQVAIARRLCQQLEPGRGGAHVHVRIIADKVEISIDTSGEPLHRRGYRTDPGPAPLREDLARALIMTSGWDRRSRLVDPMVGSGTIAIEAALLAAGRPPGEQRRFAFMDAPCFDEPLWERAVAAAQPRKTAEVEVFGSDRDTRALERAAQNAKRAKVTLQLAESPLSVAPGLAAPLADAGALVCNPPWGDRMAGDKRALYQSLGGIVQTLPLEWRAGVVGPEEIGRQTKALQSVLMTDARGTKVRFFRRR